MQSGLGVERLLQAMAGICRVEPSAGRSLRSRWDWTGTETGMEMGREHRLRLRLRRVQDSTRGAFAVGDVFTAFSLHALLVSAVPK